jgi:succinyl-CoA synthetase beta subunit
VDLLEYQGKQYFARYGVPVSDGEAAEDVETAVTAAERIGYPVVVKAQVRVGGRGKAGGVRVAHSTEEARAAAEAILGLDIKGHIVQRVWVEQATDIAKEYYASFTLDRTAKSHLCMLSARGGVDIEQVAEESPEAIARLEIDPLDGIDADGARRLAQQAGIDTQAIDGVAGVLVSLYRCYEEGDADLVEINPLVLTTDGRVHALDAKVTLDDSAAFRHPEWEVWRDLNALEPRERLAREKGLQYVGLDGTVGIIANGAGLAMSTCDVVKQVGGEPANFLDIGGGANAEVMASALEVIATDEKVRSIFVNVFGGITRGEEVAKGIVQALERVHIDAPIVVRLDGTNAEQGRAILAEYGSEQLISSPTMLDAARRASELAAQRA